MVAEPGPTTSEKRQPLLKKEQIIEKINENPETQTIQETYESLSTVEQTPDVLMREMVKQSIEVTKVISQDRIQQCTLEQIIDTSVSQVVKELNETYKVFCRDRSQQQSDNVIAELNQDETNKTRMMRNAGSESGIPTMMKTMGFGDCDSSMERERDDSDVSIMIQQICAKSVVISQCVFYLSGMTDQLQHETKCCMRLIGTLQVEALSEMSHKSYCDEEMSKMTKKKDLEADVMSNSTMFTSPEVIDEAGQVSMKLTLEELKNVETNRTTMQDTLVGKYKLDGINTLEEMDVNDMMITDRLDRYVTVDTVKGVCLDKQSPDIAGDVHVNKDDLDNSAGDQIIMSEPCNAT